MHTSNNYLELIKNLVWSKQSCSFAIIDLCNIINKFSHKFSHQYPMDQGQLLFNKIASLEETH